MSLTAMVRHVQAQGMADPVSTKQAPASQPAKSDGAVQASSRGDESAPREALGSTTSRRTIFEIVVILLCLGLGLVVALSPQLVYAPTPRVILFFLMAMLPALLFADKVAAKFELQLPGLCITAAGAGGAMLALLFLLNHLSKPDQQIAVYRVVDENNEKFSLESANVIEVHPDPRGLAPTRYIDGNILVLVFPEQLGGADVTIRDPMDSKKIYEGAVTYAGTRTSVLRLGKDLVIAKP